MSIYEGVKGYGVDYRDEYGRRHRMTVGTREAAIAVERQITTQVETAKARIRTFEHSANLSTLAAWEAWQSQRFIAERTRVNGTRRLQTFLTRYASTPCAQISPHTLTEYLASRAQAVAPATLYQTARLLKMFFAWAREQAVTPTDPAREIRLKPPTHSAGFALSTEQQAEILEAWPRRSRLKGLIALDAGLARADIHSLRRSQIDLTERTLSYYRVKTRVHATIPLTARLYAALAQHIGQVTAPDAKLFRAQAGSSSHSLTTRVAATLSFTFRFHDLRHTFISRVAATGCRNRIIQALGAHAPQTPTEKYDHPSLDELRQVIQAMEKGERLAR